MTNARPPCWGTLGQAGWVTKSGRSAAKERLAKHSHEQRRQRASAPGTARAGLAPQAPV